jgi:acyl dehydratase
LVTLTVGATIPELAVTITREQIRAYAGASGDHNPIHLDDAVATAVGLPGVIAHGMLDMGLLSRAITDWLEDPSRLRRLKVRFAAVVQPGDTVTCKGVVDAIDEGARTAQVSVWVENQRGEKVLSHGEAVVSL